MKFWRASHNKFEDCREQGGYKIPQLEFSSTKQNYAGRESPPRATPLPSFPSIRRSKNSMAGTIARNKLCKITKKAARVEKEEGGHFILSGDSGSIIATRATAVPRSSPRPSYSTPPSSSRSMFLDNASRK